MLKYKLIPIILVLACTFSCKTKKKATPKDATIEANAEKAMDKFGKTMDFSKLPDTLKVAHLARRWNGCNSLRFVDSLHSMYANQVHYYGEVKNRNECIQDKKTMLLQNRDYYQRIIGGIGVRKSTANQYRCHFTKYVTTQGVTTAIPSYLIFERDSSGRFLIIAESDPVNDVYKKNKKDSLKTLMLDYQVSNTSIKGDFDADGLKENLYIIGSGDGESPSVSFYFSKETLSPIELQGATGATLLNEGDLDGDGGEEFSAITSGGRTMRVYTFKRGEWKLLTEFQTTVSSAGADRSKGVELAGAGYISIRSYEQGRDTIRKVNIW
jgi:hypothetical protein